MALGIQVSWLGRNQRANASIYGSNERDWGDQKTRFWGETGYDRVRKALLVLGTTAFLFGSLIWLDARLDASERDSDTKDSFFEEAPPSERQKVLFPQIVVNQEQRPILKERF